MTFSLSRRALGAAALLAVTFHVAPPASAEETWPNRFITMVVPFTPGTTSDVIARGLVDYLSTKLGQPVVIDNRGGAGGNIGAAVVARAPADGYTLLFSTTGPAATNKLMYKEMPFDPQRDFVPVVLVGKTPVMAIARTSAPFSTLKELIDYAKANPDKLTAGFAGTGTLGHVTGELLQAKTGIRFGHIQYRGSAQIITDLIGEHIDITTDAMGAYVSNILDSKIKALAIASSKRWSKLPNVPTISESGLPGFEASVWYAILAPTGVPREVVARVNAATNEYLKLDRTKATLDDLAVEIAGGTPDELNVFINSEIAKWGPIVKSANIQF